MSVRPKLWNAFFKGGRLACARLITAVENDPDALPEILDRIIPAQRGGLRVGGTGPPGVGKSTGTAGAAHVLAALGLDRIFIETVGGGQAELDVIGCTDLVVLVLQPGTGDIIQALKAGIIEAADLPLVNKSDLQGTEALLESLRFLMDIRPVRKDRPFPRVLEASALLARGMDAAAAGAEG